MKNRILGIDPGTAIVGWAILEESPGSTVKISTVAYGHITTDKSTPSEERLLEIGRDLTEVIKTYKPSIAAVEDLFFFKNAKTVITVAQARGVILYVCKKNGLETSSYTPLQVKQSLTTYGRASKQQVQAMVKKILRLKEIPKPDDTADALAIALTHHYTHKFTQKLPK